MGFGSAVDVTATAIHPLGRKAESFVEVEEGHQKTKAQVCMKKAGTERFRNRFCCQRAQRSSMTAEWAMAHGWLLLLLRDSTVLGGSLIGASSVTGT